MEKLQEFITAPQAAKLSGYNSDYVSSLIRTGKLRGKKVGKNWMTTEADLVRYLRATSNAASLTTYRRGVLARFFTSLTSSARTMALTLVVAVFFALIIYGVYASIYNSGYKQAQATTNQTATQTAENISTSPSAAANSGTAISL